MSLGGRGVLVASSGKFARPLEWVRKAVSVVTVSLETVAFSE